MLERNDELSGAIKPGGVSQIQKVDSMVQAAVQRKEMCKFSRTVHEDIPTSANLGTSVQN